jgi:hypothetical protein
MNVDTYNFLAYELNSITKIAPYTFTDYYHRLVPYMQGDYLVPADLYSFEHYNSLIGTATRVVEADTRSQAKSNFLLSFHPNIGGFIDGNLNRKINNVDEKDVIAIKKIAGADKYVVHFMMRPENTYYESDTPDVDIPNFYYVNGCGVNNTFYWNDEETIYLDQKNSCNGQTFGSWAGDAAKLGIPIYGSDDLPDDIANEMEKDYDEMDVRIHEYDIIVEKGEPIAFDGTKNADHSSGMGKFWSAFPNLRNPDAVPAKSDNDINKPTAGTSNTQQTVHASKITKFETKAGSDNFILPDDYDLENLGGKSFSTQRCYPGSVEHQYLTADGKTDCSESRWLDHPSFAVSPSVNNPKIWTDKFYDSVDLSLANKGFYGTLDNSIMTIEGFRSENNPLYYGSYYSNWPIDEIEPGWQNIVKDLKIGFGRRFKGETRNFDRYNLKQKDLALPIYDWDYEALSNNMTSLTGSMDSQLMDLKGQQFIHWNSIPSLIPYITPIGKPNTRDDIEHLDGPSVVTTGLYWTKIEDVKQKANELGFRFELKRLAVPYKFKEFDISYANSPDAFMTQDGDHFYYNDYVWKGVIPDGHNGFFGDRAYPPSNSTYEDTNPRYNNYWNFSHVGTKGSWGQKTMPYEDKNSPIWWPNEVHEDDTVDGGEDGPWGYNFECTDSTCQDCRAFPAYAQATPNGTIYYRFSGLGFYFDEIAQNTWPMTNGTVSREIEHNNADVNNIDYWMWNGGQCSKTFIEEVDGEDVTYKSEGYCMKADGLQVVYDCNHFSTSEMGGIANYNKLLVAKGGGENFEFSLKGYQPFLYKLKKFVIAKDQDEATWIRPIPKELPHYLSPTFKDYDIYRTDFVKSQQVYTNDDPWRIESASSWSGNYIYNYIDTYGQNFNLPPNAAWSLEEGDRASWPYGGGTEKTRHMNITWYGMIHHFSANPIFKVVMDDELKENLAREKLNTYPPRYIFQNVMDFQGESSGAMTDALFKFRENDLVYQNTKEGEYSSPYNPISLIDPAEYFNTIFLRWENGRRSQYDPIFSHLFNDDNYQHDYHFNFSELIIPEVDANYLPKRPVFGQGGSIEGILSGEGTNRTNKNNNYSFIIEADDDFAGGRAGRIALNFYFNDVISLISGKRIIEPITWDESQTVLDDTNFYLEHTPVDPKSYLQYNSTLTNYWKIAIGEGTFWDQPCPKFPSQEDGEWCPPRWSSPNGEFAEGQIPPTSWPGNTRVDPDN